jgi:transposase
MNNLPLFVGVDYHQDQLQVCVIDSQAKVHFNKPLPNDAPALARLIKPMGRIQAVTLEACCGAADFGQALAAAGPFRVELAHPGYVARLKQSPDKSDFGDSRLLADLTRVGYVPRVWLAPSNVRDLRQLTNHRQRLVDQRRNVKLQIGAILREQRVKLEGGRWSKVFLARARDNDQLSAAARWIVNDLLDELDHLSKKIKSVQQRLEEATGDDPLVARLLTIEGVGQVTAWMLAAWIGRFDRFANGKQLSRYCGLSPRNASSGKRQADAGLIDAANKQLRAVLIQAAQRLIRTDGRWSELARRLSAGGKPKCLVVAAVANRWVRSMHHRMLSKPPRTTAAETAASE